MLPHAHMPDMSGGDARMAGISMIGSKQSVKHSKSNDISSQSPILVVEDHEDTRHVVATFLTDDGFAVCTAADGVEALERLDANRPCLILLDVTMPVMNGITFAQQLRRHPDPQLADTPVILLTALVDVEGAVKATRTVDVIQKPISFDRVVAADRAPLPATLGRWRWRTILMPTNTLADRFRGASFLLTRPRCGRGSGGVALLRLRRCPFARRRQPLTVV
jgi:CheY-like chemotaxis protein